MNTVFERIKGIFKRKKRTLIIESRKMSKITNPDKIIKICLCPQHKDYITVNGEVPTSSLIMYIRMIANCPTCKVEVV